LALVEHIREKLPGVTLRTTLIAGFPGETEEEFDELLCFVQQSKFERLGCFAYSEEEGTPAATMPGMMDLEERRRRANIVMEAQMQVAFDLAESKVGSVLTVLAEGKDWDNDGMWGGRSRMDAPDIDTKVWFTAPDTIQPGDMVQVEITATEGYDLVGRML
jgi:ribosomal protein S12 methylthiotransferase